MQVRASIHLTFNIYLSMLPLSTHTMITIDVVLDLHVSSDTSPDNIRTIRRKIVWLSLFAARLNFKIDDQNVGQFYGLL